MSVYEITIEIESGTRPERLRETIDRIILHTFGSSGELTNFVEIDNDHDPQTWVEDTRTVDQQATDDHNEGVTYSLGWKRYTRTDGTVWTNPDLEED